MTEVTETAQAEPKTAFDSMVHEAKELGSNWRTARNRKRKLAVHLLTACKVDKLDLEELIEASRRSMGYAKLDKPEQRQAKVFFSDLRTISGAWPDLEAETQAAFLAGELIFSTLKSAIDEARKAADKREADEEAKAEAGEEARSHADADIDGEPPVEVADMSDVVLQVAQLLQADVITDDEQAAIAVLIEAVDAYRAKVAEQVAIAA